MPINKQDLLDWAEKRYGYGRWEAPYWFLGPEEGMDKGGKGNTETKLKAWLDLGQPEVCDCKEFHARIDVPDWHEPAPGPELPPTWWRLILLLLTILGNVEHKDEAQILAGAGVGQLPQLEKSLRHCQRERWGSRHSQWLGSKDETCVVELSAFPAKGFAFPVAGEYLTENEILEIREKRIKFFCQKIEEHNPKLVVMYGLGKESSWKKLAGGAFKQFKIRDKRAEIQQSGSVTSVLAPQPVGGFGIPTAYWLELGRKLRTEYPKLSQI